MKTTYLATLTLALSVCAGITTAAQQDAINQDPPPTANGIAVDAVEPGSNPTPLREPTWATANAPKLPGRATGPGAGLLKRPRFHH
jgi:hypothetical protein